MGTKYLTFEKEAMFPNLVRGQYHVTSEETPEYNCIAHAAEKNDNWWWPDDAPAYWPEGLEKAETLDGFVLAYETVGFKTCPTQSRELEPNVVKVAIYVDQDGVPTHAARQIPGGAWTSKLGDWEDIQHQTLEAMEAGADPTLGYGKVALIMRRPL